MARVGTVAVLAGAREAHAVIDGLMRSGNSVIASLPEEERSFAPLPVPTRLGPFASAGEIQGWLAQTGAETVMDASHAFDARISALAQSAAAAGGLRYLRVLRAPWQAAAGDRWTTHPDLGSAVETIRPEASVFSNTGWRSLPDYERFRGRRVFLRQTHAATLAPPFAHVVFVAGTPPFSQADEERLFRNLGITHLICRNVGGAASASKLLAARRLGLDVLMIDRPPLPSGLTVAATVRQALDWAASA